MEPADLSQFVRTRVAELRQMIPERTRGRITMAVGIAEDEDGRHVVLIATSEPRGYLRPGVIIREGEVLVSGLAHAEEDIVSHVLESGWSLIAVGATRPICPDCAHSIQATGARISTAVKP
jgi:filamentous hemagglutinin